MAPLAVESSFYLRPCTTASSSSSESERPEVIHLRLSHDVLEQLAKGQVRRVEVQLNSSKPTLVVDGTVHPLQRVDETSPHELYRLSHSGPRAKPSTLSHIGAISAKLSLRQTLASSGTAASRLKERRGEEEARREAKSAVLLDEPVATSSRLSKRPEAGPAAKLRDALGQTAARSASLPSSSSSTSKGVPPSTRLRLIHLLAQGPLTRRKIVALLKSPEPSIIKLLSVHAHAPAELQPPVTSAKVSKKFKGPVNRRSAPSAPPLRSPTISGPGTVYALLDQVYASDVRLDWPTYDARSRVEVSELAEAAFERLHLPLEAPERNKLFPDGRPSNQQREVWRKERAVERMDDGEELSEAEEEDLEEDQEILLASTDAAEEQDETMQEDFQELELQETSIERTATPLKGLGLSGAAQTSGSGSGSASRSSLESRQTEVVAVSSDEASASTTSLKPATRATVSKKKPSSAIERIKKAVKAKGPTPALRAREMQKTRSSSDSSSSSKDKPVGIRARPVRNAAGRSSLLSTTKEKETAESNILDLPSSENKRVKRNVSISDVQLKPSSSSSSTKEAAALTSAVAKRIRRQSSGAKSTDEGHVSSVAQTQQTQGKADGAAAQGMGEVRRSDVRSREYTDTESEDSATATANATGTGSRRASKGNGTRRVSHTKPASSSTTTTTKSPSQPQAQPAPERQQAQVQQRHGVSSSATRAAEPWLDVRSVADWHQLRERFLRVHGAYRENCAVVAQEKRALQADLITARSALPPSAASQVDSTAAVAVAAAASNRHETEEGEASPTHPRTELVLDHNNEYVMSQTDGTFAWRHNGASSRSPMLFDELASLIQRQIDMHGQLQRMKETLQSSKRLLEQR